MPKVYRIQYPRYYDITWLVLFKKVNQPDLIAIDKRVDHHTGKYL